MTSIPYLEYGNSLLTRPPKPVLAFVLHEATRIFLRKFDISFTQIPSQTSHHVNKILQHQLNHPDLSSSINHPLLCSLDSSHTFCSFSDKSSSFQSQSSFNSCSLSLEPLTFYFPRLSPLHHLDFCSPLVIFTD